VPFDNSYSMFLKHNLINTVKNKNICNLDQAIKVFKSSAYLAWDNTDILSNIGISEINSTPSEDFHRSKGLGKRRAKSNKVNSVPVSNSDHAETGDNFDTTLIPTACNKDYECFSKDYPMSSGEKNNNYTIVSDNEGGSESSNLVNLFPAPGIVVKDIFEIYKSNKLKRERESALLNYINLLFRKNN